ncbi:transposase [Myxococcus sp. RHSTA-1-4]|uniref:IS66 family insertion sequence element accessory protein TnpA n=1 Tax=Myxococcus sp. RHSTA-1-4 TaxID=2874601 RepID=UPI001CBDC2FA|nr:transposase [Myxococcus sp. RHSTA-1-4]MBZ4418311.1 transposase [Myxococcus sp. RHSTA-1-4]
MMTTSLAVTTKTEPAWLAAARQPRWTPDVVRAWKAEGGTQSAFMRRYGLPRERLRFWTKRGEEKAEAKRAPGFVPVEVASAAVREEAVVEVGGVRVRVDGGASQELVTRVLWAVKEVQGC